MSSWIPTPERMPEPDYTVQEPPRNRYLVTVEGGIVLLAFYSRLDDEEKPRFTLCSPSQWEISTAIAWMPAPAAYSPFSAIKPYVEALRNYRQLVRDAKRTDWQEQLVRDWLSDSERQRNILRSLRNDPRFKDFDDIFRQFAAYEAKEAA
jgi:hypothetical protein